jgi:hypothetical protein
VIENNKVEGRRILNAKYNMLKIIVPETVKFLRYKSHGSMCHSR